MIPRRKWQLAESSCRSTGTSSGNCQETENQLPCGSTGTSSGNCQETENQLPCESTGTSSGNCQETENQLPFWSTGTSAGNCQETETCRVGACQTPRQPLQSHPSGHLGGWATQLSAEDMLDGQHQRVDIPAHARTAHKGLLQKKKIEEDLC